MIWFVLFQLLGFAAVVGLWFLYGKYFRKFPADSWYDVILDNVKKFLISFAVMFVVLCVVMVKPLYYSAKCSIHGTSMNANTKYSWVMGTCLMETKNKSWIPVKITRGVPDGADNHDDAYGE